MVPVNVEAARILVPFVLVSICVAFLHFAFH